jgi:hypothetical protein
LSVGRPCCDRTADLRGSRPVGGDRPRRRGAGDRADEGTYRDASWIVAGRGRQASAPKASATIRRTSGPGRASDCSPRAAPAALSGPLVGGLPIFTNLVTERLGRAEFEFDPKPSLLRGRRRPADLALRVNSRSFRSYSYDKRSVITVVDVGLHAVARQRLAGRIPASYRDRPVRMALSRHFNIVNFPTEIAHFQGSVKHNEIIVVIT